MVDHAMQWLSRTLAIVIFMVAPVFVGKALDRQFGTSFLTPCGFVLGTIVATGLLLILARKLTPPAGGTALPSEDDSRALDDER